MRKFVTLDHQVLQLNNKGEKKGSVIIAPVCCAMLKISRFIDIFKHKDFYSDYLAHRIQQPILKLQINFF